LKLASQTQAPEVNAKCVWFSVIANIQNTSFWKIF